MRRASALLLLGACSSSEIAYLSSEGLSTLLIVESIDDTTRATAYDVATKDVRVEATDGAEVLALGYEVAPSGLSLGRVELVERGRPLPPADRFFELDGAQWSSLAVAPPAVAELKLRSDELCLSFAVSIRPFPGEATFAVALDRDRVFSGTHEGKFYLVTAGETLELTTLSTATPYAAAFARGDEIYLVGPGTAFAHGHPDRGFTHGPPLATPMSRIARLSGAPSDAPLELYAMDPSRAVQRFDGSAWAQVRAPSPIVDQELEGIAWSAPGKALVIGAEARTAIELSIDGSERRFRFDLQTFPRVDGLRKITWVRDVGLLIGTELGVILQRSGETWERRPLAATSVGTDAILGLGDGRFLAGGRDGVFVQWGPGVDDVCPPLGGLGAESSDVIAPLGDGFIAFSGSSERDSHTYVASRQ